MTIVSIDELSLFPKTLDDGKSYLKEFVILFRRLMQKERREEGLKKGKGMKQKLLLGGISFSHPL